MTADLPSFPVDITSKYQLLIKLFSVVLYYHLIVFSYSAAVSFC